MDLWKRNENAMRRKMPDLSVSPKSHRENKTPSAQNTPPTKQKIKQFIAISTLHLFLVQEKSPLLLMLLCQAFPRKMFPPNPPPSWSGKKMLLQEPQKGSPRKKSGEHITIISSEMTKRRNLSGKTRVGGYSSKISGN